MDEDAPMDLVDDRFDDVDIEDQPIEDNESYYNRDGDIECDEEEVVPTTENFRPENRYKPSHHTPRELPTIREENRDDVRSNTSSRVTTRPPSSMSDKSNDLSNQFGFQNGGHAIDQFTDQFYSEDNRAERLFPEVDLVNKGYVSPAKDKQHSWEPSVCHYEKQPTPEVQNNSPGLVFANMSSRKEQPLQLQRKQDTIRTGRTAPENFTDENNPMSRRLSPERNILTTSPMDSSKFLEEKTSTPKRPGGSNRLGHRALPNLEISSIYAISPQRSSTTSRNYQSRHPTNSLTPNSATTCSDTMLSNRTISNSIVQNVLSGVKMDRDLLVALEDARKKRESHPIKPDFRLNSRGSKSSASQRPKSGNYESSSNKQSSSSTTTNHSSTYNNSHFRKSQDARNSANVADLTNSNTTNQTSNISRISTARSNSSRSRQRGGFSDSSLSTVIPNVNSTTTITSNRDGRDSVSSCRTMSRASSTMTVGGSHAQTTSEASKPKPLKIHSTRLAFGDVPLGETLTMELEIENISDRPCQTHSSIDSKKTTQFQIVDHKMTMIDPKKSMKLRVAFTPTSIGRYTLYLVVEVPAQNYTKQIALWGYGGHSKISLVPEKYIRLTANSSEYVMYSSDMRRIQFKLKNTGDRHGFALMSVFDSAMRPVPIDFVRFNPSRGVVVSKHSERNMEICIDNSYLNQYDEFTGHRSSSVMSTASTSSMVSQRRRFLTGTDFVVQVAWGEENLRDRLRMLEIQTGHHQSVDGHDFTSQKFFDEKPVIYPPPSGYPTIFDEDFDLFASSYNTFYINIFTSPSGISAFHAAAVNSRRIGVNNDITVLETSGFRHETFVSDLTMIPRQNRRM